MKDQIRQLIDKHLKKSGIRVEKKIHEGYSGLFTYISPTYEIKTVHSVEELNESSHDGYYIKDDVGYWLLRALYNQS